MKAVSSGSVHVGILPALLLALLSGMSSSAWALGDQWYIGLGGGASILDPTTEDSTIETEENSGASGTLFLGADLDDTSSIQLQLHSLGEAGLSGSEQVNYYAGDASVLYRFVDSRDHAPRGKVFGASFYGRFGLGFLERDSTVDLDKDAPVYFGAGAGIELYLTRNLAVRAEGLYLESDASTFGLSVVGRFGGRRQNMPQPPRPAARTFPVPMPEPKPASIPELASVPAPAPAPELAPAPAPAPESKLAPTPASETALALVPETELSPETASTSTLNSTATPVRPQPLPAEAPLQSFNKSPAGVGNDPDATTAGIEADSSPTQDSDQDGIADDQDECLDSAVGYPVLGNGCALLDGVLSGIQFIDSTAELLPGSSDQLDFLAQILIEYPQARIELKAYADNTGDEREQSILTRARLKTIGTYLVLEGGIRARRLQLRSFGGTEPIADNRTESGRRTNNRIEISEYLR